jgi:hypothetical protein
MMRRSALLIYTGLMLACFSGCHSHWWHRKHHNAEYVDACGCGGSVVGTGDYSGPVELSHIVSSPTGAIPGPPAASIPGPPGPAAAQAPPGVKVSTPK